MDVVVKFALSIGLYVAFMVLLVLAYFLFDFLRSKYRSKKYDGYDRDLSTRERQYLLKSIAAIDNLYEAPPSIPKWQSWAVYTSSIPALILTSLITFLAWKLLDQSSLEALQQHYAPAFILETGGQGLMVVCLILIFLAVLSFASWLIYYLLGRSEDLGLFVAMNTDASGFDKESVRLGHVERLLHNLLAYKVSPDHPFEPGGFMLEKNVFYRKASGWISLAIVLLALVFAAFDAKQIKAVTSEGVFIRSNFLIKNDRQLSIEDIERVKIRCHTHDDGKQHASYHLFLNYDLPFNEDNLVDIKNVIDNLEGLYELDKVLRENSVEIRPYITTDDGEEKYMLEQSCTDAVTSSVNFLAVAGVFHISEFIGKTP